MIPGRAAGAAALALTMLAGGPPIVDQQVAPFKSGAATVAVYTTVMDAGGRLVTDLDRDQFEVFDNGRLQTISTFANDVQPITVVMLLDRSLSMLRNFRLVKDAAGAFVDRLVPGDKARIGSFSDRVQVDPPQFSSDKGELLTILATELQPAGPTPLWNAIGVGMTALLHQEGRRVVLVFTDGMDEPLNGGAHNLKLNDVVERSENEDVMIYAIGLAGGHAVRTRRPADAGRIRAAGHGRRRIRPGPRRQAGSGTAEGGRGERRRLFRADLAARSVLDLRAHRRRVASPVPHRIRAAETGWQDPQARGARSRATGSPSRARKSYVAPRS